MPPRTGPLARATLRRITADIAALKRRADVVVVLPHWGTQYTHRPERSQRLVARAFAAVGADLVFGGHPHWVQGWEKFGSTTVVHSLGNFVFDMDFSRQTQEGVFVEVVLWGGQVKAVEPVPYAIGADFAPRLSSPDRPREILADVASTSRGPYRRTRRRWSPRSPHGLPTLAGNPLGGAVLEALSPPRRRVLLCAAGLALLLVLALVATLLVRSWTGAIRPVAMDEPGPVLLVPGYGGDVGSLAPLATALRTAGRTVAVVAPEGDGTGDLHAQADRLDAAAQEALRAGAPSVDVVGYSAGGVVARLWVRDHGGAKSARRVLTLGSPHHGARQAELGAGLAGGCPPACAQLAPDSDLLRRLNAGDETPAGPAWVTVRTTADRVVTPTDSAALDGALNLLVQDICPGSAAAHGDLPGHPVVLAALGSVLGSGPPSVPADVTC